MTNYSQNTSFTPKDSLSTGDPNKLVLGSGLDGEFSEIQTAIATKYEASDIATQAQAIAGASNTVLMTPLRVAQYLGGSGGGSGAGMLADIVALADPNADRGLFWDDSADAVALFSLGTGLNFTGTVLGLSLGSIDHDSLLNWVSNKHIDHTSVTLTAGSGLTGGGTIAASRSFAVDLTGLTADATPDTSADYMLTYDASAAANKKVLLSNLVGTALGDGSWYLNAPQALSAGTEATVVFNTAEYNSLSRGTFSTGSGVYTAGASASRVNVNVQLYTASLAAGATLTVTVYQNAVAKCAQTMRNDADHTVGIMCVGVAINLSLTASDTITVKATASAACSLAATNTRVSHTELA